MTDLGVEDELDELTDEQVADLMMTDFLIDLDDAIASYIDDVLEGDY